jgi:rhodanese-related sulfurtransferase
MDFILNTNNLILLVMFLLSGALLLGPNFRGFINGQTLTPGAATQLINRQKALIIDVRSAEEFASGHIARSKNIDASQLTEGLNGIKTDKSAPVILVCATGRRTVPLINKLKKVGYNEVFSLDGGLKAWSDAGLLLVKA